MNVTELTHPDLAHEDWHLVRWELFVVSDVRDVRPSRRPDTVEVVHRGEARVEEWLAVLESAGMVGGRARSEPAA